MKKQGVSARSGKLRTALMLIPAMFLLAALFGSASARTIKVTATIPPFADMARRIGGDMVDVRALLRPGQGPHTYEPAPGDVKMIESSDVIIMAGFGLENWLQKILAAPGAKGRVVVDCSRAVDRPIKGARDGHGHDHGDINPHYWLDPSLMARAAEVVGQALASKLPGKGEEIRKRTDEYVTELDRLDREIAARLSRPGLGREFVSFHSAWDYFAARYGLIQAGVIETAPGREPSARHFVSLVKKIRETGAGAVMTEPQFSPRLSETLAKEAGVKVVMVDPIGGVKGRDGYIELMLWNAAQFEKALEK